MSSQDSMFLPSLPGRAAPWDTSSAHNRHWGQSPVSPGVLTQAISLHFPLCHYRCHCALQMSVSLLPRQLQLTFLGNFQHLTFLPVMTWGCVTIWWAPVLQYHFQKSVAIFLQDLSNFMLKSPNDPLRWPHSSSGSILFTFLYLNSSEELTLHSGHGFLTNFLQLNVILYSWLIMVFEKDV